MDLNQRISALEYWGKAIASLDEAQLAYISNRAAGYNSWFTRDSVMLSLQGILKYLDRKNLDHWIRHYDLKTLAPRSIGLVMAGNIPLAGFHDLLTVLITGHKAQVKLSSQDPFLLPYLTDLLIEVEPSFKHQIEYTERLKDFDAVIATGSDNSARYFNYYFPKYPHIIRKNRTSCALFNGNESPQELKNVGKDIFQYFGLGCRNVSKIWVPKGYDFSGFFQSLQPFHDVANHHKYNNNYDYQKSILLVNEVEHLDSGFLLLQQSEKLVSPVSVLYYDIYNTIDDLKEKITADASKIQCIVAKDTWWPGSVLPGTAQQPDLWDYADGVDTVQFLNETFS